MWQLLLLRAALCEWRGLRELRLSACHWRLLNAMLDRKSICFNGRWAEGGGWGSGCRVVLSTERKWSPAASHRGFATSRALCWQRDIVLISNHPYASCYYRCFTAIFCVVSGAVLTSVRSVCATSGARFRLMRIKNTSQSGQLVCLRHAIIRLVTTLKPERKQHMTLIFLQPRANLHSLAVHFGCL